MIAQREATSRRRLFHRSVLFGLAVLTFFEAGRYRGECGEQFILFGFRNILEWMAKPAHRLAVEDGQRLAEFLPRLRGIHIQQQVDEAIHLGLARVRHQAFRQQPQGFILVGIERLWRPGSGRNVGVGAGQKRAIGQMFENGMGHSGAPKDQSGSRAAHQSTNHFPARESRVRS